MKEIIDLNQNQKYQTGFKKVCRKSVEIISDCCIKLKKIILIVYTK